jgi:hypothetical protein
MGIILFAISVLVITILAILIFVKSPLTYFKTKEGRGVAVGIVLAILISLGVALLFPAKVEALEYFESGEVFVGLDYTKKISPMCDVGVNNDKLTSNLGLKASILTSDDHKTDISTKYTHHSCAVNPDNKSYDAVGIEVKYKLW